MEFRVRAQEEWKKQIKQTSKPNVNKRLKFEMRAATAVMVELQTTRSFGNFNFPMLFQW